MVSAGHLPLATALIAPASPGNGLLGLSLGPGCGWQDQRVYRALSGWLCQDQDQESPRPYLLGASPMVVAGWGGPLLSGKCLGISHLMRTKGINWWFRPNETAVQINSPHQQKQTEPLNELPKSIKLNKLLPG